MASTWSGPCWCGHIFLIMCYSYDPLGSSQETQVFDFQGNMVAKLKFKGIYRKAPPGVEPVVLFDPTREASPSPDTDRGGSCSPKTLGWPMPTLIPQIPVPWRSPPTPLSLWSHLGGKTTAQLAMAQNFAPSLASASLAGRGFLFACVGACTFSCNEASPLHPHHASRVAGRGPSSERGCFWRVVPGPPHAEKCWITQLVRWWRT